MSLPSWHVKTSEQVLKDLGTSNKGLTHAEAAARLRKHGPNKLREEEGTSALSLFLSQFSGFLIRILIGAVIISIIMGLFVDNTHLIDAAVILIIVILSAVLGFTQEYKAEKTLAALKKMTSQTAIVIRDGKQMKVRSETLVPGDIVLVDEGTNVPSDMRIIEAVELQVDEAVLTGESSPVSKVIECVDRKCLADLSNMLWSGTIITYGRGAGIVTETGMNTQIGRIAHQVQETKDELTPLQKKLNEFGHRLGTIILGVCFLVVIIGIIRLGPLSGNPIGIELIVAMIMTGIALAIAAIPEGLVAVVTTTLALGVRRLSKKNALMKSLPAVEALGSTTVICSDKTGTLTKNEMTVTRIWHSSKMVEVTGEGYSPKGRFMFKGGETHPSTDTTLYTLLKAGAICNNAKLAREKGRWSIIGDPTEGSLVVAAIKAGFTEKRLEQVKRLNEIPFSSERKMMSVVARSSPATLYSKGAPENILSLSTHMMRNGKTIRLTKKDRDEILSANMSMTKQALRVLGVAMKPANHSDPHATKESGLVFLGLVGMMDPPREGVREDIALCRKAGIKVVMITGDHVNTATSIADQLNLSKEDMRSMTGEELDRISDSKLKSMVNSVSVYARVNPEHKVRIVEALKRKGHIIAMTGDGVNDAPALKKANIGVAMGIKGTDVSKEASDMILQDDNFSTIVAAVREGRGIYDNIKKFIQYMLSSNTAEVLIVFFAILIGFTDPLTGMVIIPLTVIQLLWINLLTDGLPALALGVDPPAPGIMTRPPRSPRERILSKGTLNDIMFVGIIITVATLFLFWLNLTLLAGSAVAITVVFTSLVVFEMVRVHAVRVKYKVGFFSNPVLIAAIAASLTLQLFVIYAPLISPVFDPIHDIFSTTYLGAFEWLQVLLMAGVLLFVMFLKDRLFGSDI